MNLGSIEGSFLITPKYSSGPLLEMSQELSPGVGCTLVSRLNPPKKHLDGSDEDVELHFEDPRTIIHGVDPKGHRYISWPNGKKEVLKPDGSRTVIRPSGCSFTVRLGTNA